jgi:hypothetical protein
LAACDQRDLAPDTEPQITGDELSDFEWAGIRELAGKEGASSNIPPERNRMNTICTRQSEFGAVLIYATIYGSFSA